MCRIRKILHKIYNDCSLIYSIVYYLDNNFNLIYTGIIKKGNGA